MKKVGGGFLHAGWYPVLSARLTRELAGMLWISLFALLAAAPMHPFIDLGDSLHSLAG